MLNKVQKLKGGEQKIVKNKFCKPKFNKKYN